MRKLSIKQIFLLGLLIRILVMPFFAHGDLYSVHKRVETIICGPQTVFSYSDFGIHAVESFFTTLTLPFTSCEELAKLHTNPLDIEKLNRTIFFFKFFYLLFEIGYWYLLWKLFVEKEEATKKKAAIFLALNPVIIYSIYMFGRFEAYNLFFSALIMFGLLSKSKRRAILFTSLLLALTLTFRLSYVLIAPALAISFGFPTLATVTSIVLTTGFFAILKLLPLLTGKSTTLLPESSWISTGAHPNYLFQAGIDTGSNILYWFFLLLGLILIWRLEKDKIISKLNPLITFSLFSALIFAAYYATSAFHPQYLTWILPFMLILIGNDKSNFLWKSFWLSMPFYFIYVFSRGNALTFGLATPVSVVFQHIEPKWFFPILSFSKWANLGKTAFSAFCIYWIYYLLKTYGKKT